MFESSVLRGMLLKKVDWKKVTVPQTESWIHSVVFLNHDEK